MWCFQLAVGFCNLNGWYWFFGLSKKSISLCQSCSFSLQLKFSVVSLKHDFQGDKLQKWFHSRLDYKIALEVAKRQNQAMTWFPKARTLFFDLHQTEIIESFNYFWKIIKFIFKIQDELLFCQFQNHIFCGVFQIFKFIISHPMKIS